MFFDQSLLFSNGQAITTTANATNLYDITGAGSGNAPTMIGGNGGTIGADMGAGEGEAVPFLVIIATVAGTGSGTVQFTLQAAPDNGSNVAGTYSVLYTSGTFVGTTIIAGSRLVVPVPPRLLTTLYGEALPRFYQLVYTVSGSFTATFTAGLMLNPTIPNGQQYPNNFIAA